MKKSKALRPTLLGLTAVMGSLLAISNVGYKIADTWRSQIDSALGTSSYEIDTTGGKFVSDYDTPEKMMAAAKAHAIKQGEEGTVVMKNDNNCLPLSTSTTKKVALFGAAAWKPFMQSSGDLKAGNADKIDLDGAFENNGFELDTTMKGIYTEILNDVTITNRFGNKITNYNKGYITAPGDMKAYQIREVPPTKFTEEGYGSAASDWKSKIDKQNTVGVVAFARGAGESNTYLPGVALDFEGNEIKQDPLRLSPDELAIIDLAKETCSKVVVLLNTGNTMEIDDITKGGAHEVDAIAYMGVINDYQCQGIVNVLTGKANATGALSDTFVKNNMSAPALQNFGGSSFADTQIAENSEAAGYLDKRYGTENILNGSTGSFPSAGRGQKNYNGSQYIVEAEGIYVGYQYYETRYYDSIMNPSSKATSTAGSTSGTWNYANEVVYSFGHGLSYLDYEQTIKSVKVDKAEGGEIKAVVEVKNKSNKDGYFLTQLYAHSPYTNYDKENLVEKSAVQFLNSKKVNVKANSAATVEITIPTKYLASYDYTKAKTYILDAGKYLFTAASGSHEATNNFLAAEGKNKNDGLDTEKFGKTVSWTNSAFDAVTFSQDHNTKITNVAANADLNYYLPGTVTYLSRKDWEGTYPKNYNKNAVKIGDSAKKDEWIKEIQGRQYEVQKGEEARNVDGKDNGVRFNAESITGDQLNNINDEYWDKLVSSISVNEAIGAVIHGGSQTDTLSIIENPIVGQNEGVNGIKGEDKVNDTTSYHYNVNSQTLLGSSFNPDLAYEWGLIEGNGGLHLKKYQVWGTGLTQRRTPYNGRNYEYISEDPMLTNRIGYGILKGCKEKGIINGPKHMGFNDQEHNRSGIAVFINEQKMRETDLRGFQGGLEDAGGQAVMIAFNRLGSTNASHHSGMLQNILRQEWGFTGIVSTDLAGKPYFDGISCTIAGITQIAEFGGNNSFINKDNLHDQGDSAWKYITVDYCKNDKKLVEQARQNLKYQFYTFANSAVLNLKTTRVIPVWETALNVTIVTTAILTGLAALSYVVLFALDKFKK